VQLSLAGNTQLAYCLLVKVIRTALFEKSLKKLGASETDILKLMAAVLADPEIGDVIPGLGGARKVRFAMKARGKRGGGRAVYVVIWRKDAAYLLLAYSKTEQSDLSEKQRTLIKMISSEVSDG